MEVLIWLIPISVVLLSIAGAAFVWAVNNRQFDDLDQHGLDVIDNPNETNKGNDSCAR